MSSVVSPCLWCTSALLLLIAFALLLTKDLTKKGKAKLRDNSFLESAHNCEVKPGPVAHVSVMSERERCGVGVGKAHI